MATFVKVQDRLFERQGTKVVVPQDGSPVEVPAGELPNAGEEVLAVEGEPAFQLRLDHEVANSSELPGEVIAALGPLIQRLSLVSLEGEEGGELHVEDVALGVQDGALVLFCDTDGMGYSPQMIETMARIFVEELDPLGLPMTLSVPVQHRS